MKLPVQQVSGPYSPVFLRLRLSDTNGVGSPICGVVNPHEHLQFERNRETVQTGASELAGRIARLRT